VAELIARAGAEVAARQDDAAHEQALLELAGGQMPPLAGVLARAHELAAAHGGFARLEALAGAAPADSVAVDTALAGLRALGAHAAAATAPAAPPVATQAPAPAPTPLPAPAPAPAPAARPEVAPAPAQAAQPEVAPAPAQAAQPEDALAPAPAQAAQPDVAPALTPPPAATPPQAAATADLHRDDRDDGDAGMLTGDEELDAILLGDAPAEHEAEAEAETETAIDRPSAHDQAPARAPAAAAPAENPPDDAGSPRRSEAIADALPATPATAAGALSPPAPVDALDGWLDDELGEVEELSFSLDGSGPTSSSPGDGELGSADPARDSQFPDEPTTLHVGRVAARVHEEATAVLPRVRGTVEEALPPLPIDGDAIPVMAGDERATAMALPPRDAELESDYDFAQAIDDFADDPRVQIVTRPGPARAGAGRDFDPSEVVTQVGPNPGTTGDLLDSALGELDLDDALEIDDIEFVEAESQPHVAPGAAAERLAAGTPPYPPASPQQSSRPPTPVSSTGLPRAGQRRPLPGLPPEPGQPAPDPVYPTQTPPAGYPAHPHAQPAHSPPPGAGPYPPDPGHTPPPYPHNAAYPQAPVYPVADDQHRPDDDDDGKKRGFFGRIFKK
jgi:hypothetical protein